MPRIMVVESDVGFAEQVRGGLQSRWPAVDVEVMADGRRALKAAAADPPELILLCVELPRVSGYSICNKLKKNPQLKAIPLIIMSSDATPEIFDQHSRLKTRADEYLIKPFAIDELLGKIAALAELPAESPIDEQVDTVVGADKEDVVVADDADDGGVIVSVESMGDVVVRDGEVMAAEGDPTHVVDQEIDLATDAAFAALEIEESAVADTSTDRKPSGDDVASGSHRLSVQGSQRPDVPQSEAISAAEGREQDAEPAPFGDSPQPLEQGEPGEPSSEGRDGGAPFPEQTAPEGLSAVESPVAPDSSADDRLRLLLQENEQLRAALREAQRSAKEPGEGARAFSRDRELLSLREVINKKEKEVLDLKDDIDAKERQILDHKDKVRELERRLRDMDEKVLVVEREMVAVREKLEAAQEDKDTLVERERGVKLRLDQAKGEIEKAYAENQQLKQRAEEEQKRLGEQHEVALSRERAAAAEQQTRLEEQHAGALQQRQEESAEKLAEQARAHEQSLVELEAENERKLQQERGTSTQALAALRQQHEASISELDVRHGAQLTQQSAQLQVQLSQLREQHETAIQQLRQEHEQAAEEAAQAQRLEVERSQGAHEEALEQLKQSQRHAQEQLEAEYAAEKESLRSRHQADIEALKGEHEQRFSEREAELGGQLQQAQQEHQRDSARSRAEHEAQLGEIREQSQAAEQQLQQRLGDLDNELRALGDQRRSEREALESTVADRESTIAQLQVDLRDALGAVGDRERQIQQHEARGENFRDQLAQAFQRIQLRDQLADKAKRALSVAIALLEEERGAAAGSVGAGDNTEAGDETATDTPVDTAGDAAEDAGAAE